MKISLCNEVLAQFDFEAQCKMAADLGYDGLEVAPYTLSKKPHLITKERRKEIKKIASDSGLEITGLHWLLVTPEGLSINCSDESVRQKTQDVMKRLVDLCADLGGTVLVHGSPKQRSIEEGDNPRDVRARSVETFRAVGKAAAKAGVICCVEPLARNETNFINTVEEGVDLVNEIDTPSVLTMIDTSAAGQTEELAVAQLIERWIPSGKIAHIQLNDTNRRGPGQGDDDFGPILKAIKSSGYDKVLAIEPFKYIPDGPTTAKHSIDYVRGILAGL